MTPGKYQYEYLGFGSTYTDSLSEQLIGLQLLDSNQYLSRLQFAENEIHEGAKIFKGQSYLGRDAILSTFNRTVAQSEIIHLSLHGLVNSNDPTKSCIIFDNRVNPFTLTPQVLQNLSVNPKLVLLSACHTADGKLYQGEGVDGMTRAFLNTGAHSVLSSLWSASEGSTQNIIIDVLKNMKAKNSTVESLRLAKINYLSNTSPSLKHPYYWSNLVLYGNSGRTVIPSRLGIWTVSIMGLILFIFIIIKLISINRK